MLLVLTEQAARPGKSFSFTALNLNRFCHTRMPPLDPTTTRFHGFLHHTVESFFQGVKVKQRETVVHDDHEFAICQSIFLQTLIVIIICELLPFSVSELTMPTLTISSQNEYGREGPLF
jgi:hypothetical protein